MDEAKTTEEFQDLPQFTQRQLQLDGRKLPPSIPFIYPSSCRYDSELLTLIKSATKNPDTLEIFPEALQLLKTIDKRVAIVSICGPYRSGKSYFLSRVLGLKEVFKLGHSMNACTRGIWLSTFVLECTDFVVLFLDTEGTGAVGEGEASENFITAILTLTTLLSSFLIYNSKSVLKKSDLSQMRYLTNCTLSRSIMIKSTSAEDLQKLQQHFPELLLLLRDVDLDFADKDDEELEITPTEYVTKYVLQRGKSSHANSSDADVGETILKMFPNFECMKIARPERDAVDLPKHDQEYNSEFNCDIQLTIDYIKKQVKIKQGFGGCRSVDGSSLAILATEFVEVLNTPGEFPDLEKSWNTVIQQKLQLTVNACVAEYKTELSSKVKDRLPIETDELMRIHETILISKQKKLQDKLRALLPSHSGDVSKMKQYQTYSSKLTARIIQQDLKTQEVIGCELYQFVVDNKQKSQHQCKSLFEKLQRTSPALPQLIESYRREATGPAKDEIYKQYISVIPGKPEGLRVLKTSHNMVEFSWRRPMLHCDCETDLEYTAERCLDTATDKWEKASSKRGLSSRFDHLKPITMYRFRVCAKNDTNKSEYSTIDVTTEAGPPNKPNKPQLELHDSNWGKLCCMTPKENDENGSPINKMCIKMFIEGDEVLNSVFNLNITDTACITQNVPLPTVKSDDTVYIRILWENYVGMSPESDAVVLLAADMIPGPPTNLRTVGRTHKMIKVRYDPPEINPKAAAYYVVQIQESKSEPDPTQFKPVKKTKKYSAIAKNLKANTEYVILVAAYNKNNKCCSSAFTLMCETKLHPAASGLASAGGAAVGAVATPIAGSVFIPAASVVGLKQGIKEKSAGKIVGGTLGLLSTPISVPLGFLSGLVAAPVGAVGGGVLTHLVLNDEDDDLSDSDDDEPENSES